MKRRIFTVILAVMIVTTFMPAASFGVSSFGSGTGEQSLKIAVPDKAGVRVYTRHSGIKSRIRHNDDLLEVLKQACYEERDTIMDEIDGKEKYYCPEVWNLMMELSEQFTQKVDSAESVNDLGELFMGFLIIKPEISEPLEQISMLQSFTIQQLSSSSDVPQIKKKMQKNLKEFFDSYEKADFSQYYWGILTTKRSKLSATISSIKTIRDFVKAQSELSSEGFGYLFGGDYYDDDFDSFVRLSDILDDYDDDEDDEEFYYYSNWLFDADEVKSNKEMFVKWAEKLLKEDMKDIGYTTAEKDFAARLKTLKKQIAAEVDCDVMYHDYNQFAAEVYRKAQQKNADREPASYGNILRFEKKMRDIFMTGYKSKTYSDAGWEELNSVHQKYLRKADGFLYQDQLSNKFLTEYKAALNKVLTLKQEQAKIAKEKAKAKKQQELQLLKTKRIKQIKKYAKNKKFDQKKSIPLAKKAAKKIKAAKTKKKVNQIYKTYKAKIKKTAAKKKKS